MATSRAPRAPQRLGESNGMPAWMAAGLFVWSKNSSVATSSSRRPREQRLCAEQQHALMRPSSTRMAQAARDCGGLLDGQADGGTGGHHDRPIFHSAWRWSTCAAVLPHRCTIVINDTTSCSHGLLSSHQLQSYRTMYGCRYDSYYDHRSPDDSTTDSDYEVYEYSYSYNRI